MVTSFYLDYKKAFDSVVHNRLLCKLWEYGIHGDLWQWCCAYLTNRRQCVRVGGESSCFLPVISGVPQGSLLGPLFYIIFINDLFTTIHEARVLAYADDTKLLMIIHGLLDSATLQVDLNKVSEWSSFCELSLNPLKCSHVNYHFNKTLSCNEYFINNDAVSTKDQVKDLGIIFSSNLQWNSHYKFIISKAYKMFYFLSRIFTYPSVIARRRLYLTLVRSQLVYCSPLWRPYLIKDIEDFERIQHRVTKFILNNYNLDYKSRLIQCKILPLMYFFELTDILFFVKSIKFPSPAFNILNYVTFNTSSTRSGSFNKLIHNFASTSYARQFYFNRISRLWNSLPFIDLSLPFNVIKSNLYGYLWNHFIHDFDPDDVHHYHYVCPCNQCSHIGFKTFN